MVGACFHTVSAASLGEPERSQAEMKRACFELFEPDLVDASVGKWMMAVRMPPACLLIMYPPLLEADFFVVRKEDDRNEFPTIT